MTFKPYDDPAHLYFVTATVLDWTPVFLRAACARIVLDSLDWHRRNKRWQLYAYVVMPNHVHLILKPEAAYSISGVLQSFGSFTAHAILAHLEDEGESALLATFTQRQDRDSTKGHQLWQPIQAKNVYSEDFLLQKLDYIHNNPVAKRWSLVEDRADYVYSSACFYDRGEVPVVEVDDIRELFA